MRKSSINLSSKIIGLILFFALCFFIAVPSEAASGKVQVLKSGESIKYTNFVASKTSNKKIVSLSQKKHSCKITAKKQGECTVTLMKKNGSKKKIYILVTKANPYYYDTSQISIKVGANKVYKASAPSACTVTYSSSDSDVASVNKKGKITGKRTGTTNITAAISYKGKQLKKYSKKVTVKNDNSSSYFNLCQADYDATQEEIRLVNQKLGQLPYSILHKFVRKGWKVVLTSKNLNSILNDENIKSEVIGLTSYDDKTIYIKKGIYNIEQSTIHEMGHWVNNYLGSYSSTVEWGKICSKEAQTFLNKFRSSNYSNWNRSEYFAEAFWKYFDENKKLEDSCPQTYWAIESIVSKFD